MSRLGLVIALVLARQVAAQSVSSPVELDATPLPASFLGIGAASLEGLTLISWTSTPNRARPQLWAVLDADGGYVVPPDAGFIGEFNQGIPAVVASDAGVWLIAWTDDSSGGGTAATRVSAQGVLLDGQSNDFPTTSYVGHLAATWTGQSFWVLDQGASLTMQQLSVEPLGRLGFPAGRPELDGALGFAMAAHDTGVWVVFTSDDAGLRAVDYLLDGGASGPPFVLDPASRDAVAMAYGDGAFAIIHGDGVQEKVLIIEPRTLVRRRDTALEAATHSHPAVVFDGQDFVMSWERGTTERELRATRVSSFGTTREAPFSLGLASGRDDTAPSLAAPAQGVVLLFYASAVAPFTEYLPTFRRIAFAAIDGGTGRPDAGASFDGGYRSADGGTLEVRTYNASCAASTSLGGPLLAVALALISRGRRRR